MAVLFICSEELKLRRDTGETTGQGDTLTTEIRETLVKLKGAK